MVYQINFKNQKNILYDKWSWFIEFGDIMGWIGLVGTKIRDSKGNSFGTIERFVQRTGDVMLEITLNEKKEGMSRIRIPLTACEIKGNTVKTKKSLKSILKAKKEQEKEELKAEKERLQKILEKRRRISEQGAVAHANESLVSEVKSVINEKKGPSTPADWIICPSCDSALKEHYKFCPYCTAALPYCPKCGKPIKKDFLACPYCGTRL